MEIGLVRPVRRTALLEKVAVGNAAPAKTVLQQGTGGKRKATGTVPTVMSCASVQNPIAANAARSGGILPTQPEKGEARRVNLVTGIVRVVALSILHHGMPALAVVKREDQQWVDQKVQNQKVKESLAAREKKLGTQIGHALIAKSSALVARANVESAVPQDQKNE